MVSAPLQYRVSFPSGLCTGNRRRRATHESAHAQRLARGAMEVKDGAASLGGGDGEGEQGGQATTFCLLSLLCRAALSLSLSLLSLLISGPSFLPPLPLRSLSSKRATGTLWDPSSTAWPSGSHPLQWSGGKQQGSSICRRPPVSPQGQSLRGSSLFFRLSPTGATGGNGTPHPFAMSINNSSGIRTQKSQFGKSLPSYKEAASAPGDSFHGGSIGKEARLPGGCHVNLSCASPWWRGGGLRKWAYQ